MYNDATGLLIETWTGTNHGSAQTDVLYGYDNQGRLASVTQVVLNGVAVAAGVSQMRYDADGGAVTTNRPTIIYTYDAAGNLVQESDPNGMTTTYTYDALDRLTNELVTQSVQQNGSTVSEDEFQESYTLNDDGSRSSETDTRYNLDASNSIYSQTLTSWTYDADGRLTSESLSILNDGTGGTSNADGHAPTPYTDTFLYDPDDNRQEEDIDGGQNVSGGSTIYYYYMTYGPNGSANNEDQLSFEQVMDYNQGQVSGTTYTYDASGNLISQDTNTPNEPFEDDAVILYTYDLRNRMTSETQTGSAWYINTTTAETTTYSYDTNGVLSSESVPSGTTGAGVTNYVTTYYLNDPNNPTGYTKAIQTSTTLNGPATTSYVLGVKVEAQASASTGTLYLMTDGHGSTRALVNSAGQTVEEYDYDAFGTMILGKHIDVSTGAMTDITADTAETSTAFGNNSTIGMPDSAS